jgi:hypothetical protein
LLRCSSHLSQRDGLWCIVPQVRQVRGGLGISVVLLLVVDACVQVGVATVPDDFPFR